MTPSAPGKSGRTIYCDPAHFLNCCCANHFFHNARAPVVIFALYQVASNPGLYRESRIKAPGPAGHCIIHRSFNPFIPRIPQFVA